MDLFRTLAQSRAQFASLVESRVVEKISTRSPGPRDQAGDDMNVFGELNTATALLLSQGDFSLAIPGLGYIAWSGSRKNSDLLLR